MLKRIKRIIFPALFFLSVLLLAEGVINARRGGDFLGNLTIVSEEGFDSGIAEAAAGGGGEESPSDGEEPQEDSFTFAAWTEFGNEPVSDEFSKKACSADVTAIRGPSYCLLPFGKSLSPQDTEGCIIGREMAEKLFGSHMAEGREVVWRDRKWTVRGVVEEPGDLLMLQASGMEEITFHKISISLDGAYDRRLTGEKFASRYGVLARPLRFDYLYGIAWLKEMVPDKWSDFGGWKENFKEYRETAKYVQNAGKSTIEAAGMKYKMKGRRYILCGVLCLLALPTVFPCKRQRKQVSQTGTSMLK